MDLIYMNAQKEDIGVLSNYDLDLAYGKDENSFECRIQSKHHCCESGWYLYIEGTEYGGIIDSIGHDTQSDEVIYSGRTWQGIMNSKVLEPDAGSAYLTVSGEANTVLAQLISRMSLGNLFKASNSDSGLMIDGYKMNRYITGYDGIRKMLATANGKLTFSYVDNYVIVSATEKHDYTQDEEFDSDQYEFSAKKNYNTVNHLVCLGAGELENRTVVHLYVDEDGIISQEQTQFDENEYAAVYDYSAVESVEELITGGIQRLKELCGQDKLSIDMDDKSDVYGVGDIVGANDIITKLSFSDEIKKKIVTIRNGYITISYEVGE